jgi:large conductance mechanosensitive channel
LKVNLIDLAIAVVLAAFFAPVITAIVDGIILNLIADAESGINPATELPYEATYLEFGVLITAIFTFVIVGFVCSLIAQACNKMKAAEYEEDDGPSEFDLLTEIRDQLSANNN